MKHKTNEAVVINRILEKWLLLEVEKNILADSVKILLYFPPFVVFTNVSKKKKKKKKRKKKNDQVSTDINHPKRLFTSRWIDARTHRLFDWEAANDVKLYIVIWCQRVHRYMTADLVSRKMSVTKRFAKALNGF